LRLFGDTELEDWGKNFGYDKVTGCYRKLYNKKLLKFYTSPDIIRAIRWAGHVALMRQTKNAHKIWVRKADGKEYLLNVGRY
jgi:hypothetical protein